MSALRKERVDLVVTISLRYDSRAARREAIKEARENILSLHGGGSGSEGIYHAKAVRVRISRIQS